MFACYLFDIYLNKKTTAYHPELSPMIHSEDEIDETWLNEKSTKKLIKDLNDMGYKVCDITQIHA